ncbi:MAG: methionyl-tRNA formyltransferase [Bacteroidetes bacterium]|nr:MAG: methionyl-tRNA formyltransferase [Bacteroidota bacterium]
MEVSPENLRVIFMGTPGFAVASLELILNSGMNVVGVITAPDKPAGRGKKLRPSAVKEFSIQHNLELLQPPNLKDPGFIRQLTDLRPDLQVVVAFRMLPGMVWKVPILGTFNLHASLLPQYRGAAPINHVLMNGERITGVTTFLIDESIDTGNILLRKRTGIGPEETAGELHDRLKVLGAGLVLETIYRLARGEVQPRSQEYFMEPGTVLRPAPRIQKDDCRIDWKRDGLAIHNMIRGLSPYPGAFTFLTGKTGEKVQLKLLRSTFEPSGHDQPAGLITTDGKEFLQVLVRGGILGITALQLEGRRVLETNEFLRGFSLSSFQPRFS